MADPFATKATLVDAISHVKTFDFYTYVYPEDVIDQFLEAVTESDNLVLPKCIFVPSQKLCRKIIKATLKFGGENESRFFMRFGLVKNACEYLKSD